MLNDNIVDKWKEKSNWKTYTHFEIVIDQSDGSMYWEEKGDVLINLDSISAIKKVVGKAVDGDDLGFYKFEMTNGNDYFVLADC